MNVIYNDEYVIIHEYINGKSRMEIANENDYDLEYVREFIETCAKYRLVTKHHGRPSIRKINILELIELYYDESLTYDDIGSRLGVANKTVTNNIILLKKVKILPNVDRNYLFRKNKTNCIDALQINMENIIEDIVKHNYTKERICKKYNISTTTSRRYFKRLLETKAISEKHFYSKGYRPLTDNEKKSIYLLYNKTEMNMREIAKEFEIGVSTVGKYARRKYERGSEEII